MRCELCKARKVKCDRAKPACSWCARRNRECVYLERQKPGSRITFGLELEAQVNRTQARLAELERRFEEHLASASTTDQLGETPPAPVVPALEPRCRDRRARSRWRHGPPPPHPSALGVALRPERRLPAAAAIRVRAAAASAAPPPPLRHDSSTASSGGFLTPHTTHPALPASALPTDADELPPQDMLYTLTDLYFKHCNTWSPILERKTVFAVLDNFPHVAQEDRVLLHAIVATTLRFFHDPRLSADAKARQYAASKRAVQVYSLDHLSVPALRARVVLCLDVLGTHNGPCGGMLVASLGQAAKQLGLCDETSVFLASPGSGSGAPGGSNDISSRSGLVRKLTTSQPQSWIEDESRRRLCWMVYILDKYATMAAAMTPGYTLVDHCVRRVLPCSYDLFSRDIPVETHWFGGSPAELEAPDAGARLAAINKSENLGSFSYHCEVIRILSRAHAFATTPLDVYSPPKPPPGATPTAASTLPSTAGCKAYLASTAACPPPPTSPPSLGGIVQDVRAAEGLDLLGPLFALSLWVAARVLLVDAAVAAGPVDPMIDLFIVTLEDMGRHWDVARCYAAILSRVVARARGGDGTWSAMRRSAHDLLNLTMATPGISYLSFGEKLGGLRKKQPASDTHTALRVASFKNYAAYMGTPIFREGLGELKDLANSSPRSSPQGTAIMCSETLWWRCHRRMISDILTTAGWTVQHLGIKEVPVKHVRWDIARLERDGSLVYDGGSGKLV
ncbi:unnamed protein product [Parascedosporium putredinis]|uniref:Zn(2)-C6 fungal-type domain-containing protein n=1 Tax=Parascedosporium putredinis TaxID=1442378 RepID=A0A9P1H2Y2_9PEZI|nr:unnamed protein product [Parascedosporium putredinis]CAI7994144.1 unnamed protein product [Parascedosporium putredinis]